MINLFKEGSGDREGDHVRYDKLLEDFITGKNYDPELVELMQELIAIPGKGFWYS